MNVEFRHVAETRHVIIVEAGIEHPALFKTHRLTQRRAEAHKDRALDLRAQVGGVQDRAALKDFADAAQDDFLLLGRNLDFHTRGDV